MFTAFLHFHFITKSIMADEIAQAFQIGQRRYRKYPLRNLGSAQVCFKPTKLNLLEEDDGESEEEENINVDINDFENFNQEKIIIKQEETITETIFYSPSSETYILSIKLPTQCFYQFCGGCSLDKTPDQRKIEEETKVNIKGIPSNQTIELKANNYEEIIHAHSSILDLYKISPKPTEYQVMSDKLLAVIKGFSQNNEEELVQIEEIKIEEYPQLEMNYDAKWQGYITKIKNFPRDCADFLLNDKGKNIKKLKTEMKGNVEYELNKQEASLEIIGYTQDQVKNGYAAFIRMLKSDRSADSFAKSRAPPASIIPKPKTKKQFSIERKFTHFISVSMENDPNLTRLQQDIFNMGIPNLVPFMTNPSNRFHVTIAVLSLTTTDSVINSLNAISNDLKAITAGNQITLTFDRIGYFGKPNAANVLFVDLLHDKEFAKFNQISTKIHQAFVKEAILTNADLNKQKTEFKGNQVKKAYHMTLAKNKGNSNQMDLTNVLSSDLKFNIKIKVADIHLMSMRTDTTNSSYPVLYSLKIV